MPEGAYVSGNLPAIIGPDHRAPLEVTVEKRAAMDEADVGTMTDRALVLANAFALVYREARHSGYRVTSVDDVEDGDGEYVFELEVTAGG